MQLIYQQFFYNLGSLFGKELNRFNGIDSSPCPDNIFLEKLRAIVFPFINNAALGEIRIGNAGWKRRFNSEPVLPI